MHFTVDYIIWHDGQLDSRAGCSQLQSLFPGLLLGRRFVRLGGGRSAAPRDIDERMQVGLVHWAAAKEGDGSAPDSD